MRLNAYIIVLFVLYFTASYSQENREVLVEIFTNSHCSLCPVAHNVIDNYLAGPNGDKINYIFYHMVYPYSDDPLYWQSMDGSDARHQYYQPIMATPQGWSDGIYLGSSTTWTSKLDERINVQSPLSIDLSGTSEEGSALINAQITRTGPVSDNDLVIHFIVTEDVYYDGRNSISNHKHVMRQMLPDPYGKSISIDLNQTIAEEQLIELDSGWDSDSLTYIVFVQSTFSKNVYQSASIRHTELLVSSADSKSELPTGFNLQQNYPNPFNPSTTITYRLPEPGLVSLKVYDLLGEEVATLVNEYKDSGTHKIEFMSRLSDDERELSSGIYIYRMSTGFFTESRKMILIR